MNLNQHVFVTEYLRHRDKIIAYATAYHLQSTRNATVIESAANRLLRDPVIAEEIRKTYDAIRSEAEQDIAKEMRTELLSIHRKREILARIATGDMYVEQHYKGKNCSQCSQYIRPTINHMLKAIDLDSKLAGHYPHQTAAPHKKFATHTPTPEEDAHDTPPANPLGEPAENFDVFSQQNTTTGEPGTPGNQATSPDRIEVDGKPLHQTAGKAPFSQHLPHTPAGNQTNPGIQKTGYT